MSKNEIRAAESEFKLVTISGELAEAVAEEMDGLGAIPFDKVKIPSGGGLAFEVPGEDEDNPDVVKEIRGVIVDHHPVNAYWFGKYDGNNDQYTDSCIYGWIDQHISIYLCIQLRISTGDQYVFRRD